MNNEIQLRIMAFFEKVMGEQLPIGLKAAYISAWITSILVIVGCSLAIYFAVRYLRPLWSLSVFMDHAREARDVADRLCSIKDPNDPYIVKGTELLTRIARTTNLEMRIGTTGFVGSLASVLIIAGCGVWGIITITELPSLFFFDGWSLNYMAELLKGK